MNWDGFKTLGKYQENEHWTELPELESRKSCQNLIYLFLMSTNSSKYSTHGNPVKKNLLLSYFSSRYRLGLISLNFFTNNQFVEMIWLSKGRET